MAFTTFVQRLHAQLGRLRATLLPFASIAFSAAPTIANTEQSMRRLRSLLAAPCTLFAVLVSSPATAQLRSLALDTTVQLGPNTFVFPRNSRDFLPDKSGKIADLSLRILFPSMVGRTPETTHELSLAKPEARSLQILLSDPTFDRQVGRTAARDVRRAIVTRIAETEVWNSPLETVFKGFARRPVLQGLTEISLLEGEGEPSRKAGSRPFGISALESGERYYAEIEQEKIKTVLNCTGTRPAPNPRCEMRFEYREITVKVGFSQAMREDWRQIRDALSGYLEANLKRP
ncbi:hypothetical protein [Bosea sp. FBZP-16]|uniref:hypothetical protein n=1 Tax=Bosea sp. FBZP-16 TaxID=2065382 RepID=UPI001319DA2C|nr:hypothetical protein [Bosea sp. FBZP-16]